MRNYIAVSFLALVLALSSCNVKPKAPEFRSIQNIEKPTYKSGDVNIKGEIVMYNPNRFGFNIKNTEIDVFINQKNVTSIKKLDLTKVKVKNRAEFAVPFDVTFPAEKVYKGLLSQGVGMLSSKTVTVR